MCFETTETARAKIAKTDIECWKILESEGQPCHWNHLPPYRVNVINPMVKIKVEIIELGEYFYKINEGYHSYKSESVAMNLGCTCVKKFIIPKGTRYYSNRTEYVSETIMLVS